MRANELLLMMPEHVFGEIPIESKF